jgi:hypothetical protein
MNNKKRVIKLIESYLNNIRKRDVELAYGVDSKIKIRDIDYLTSTKSILIDCTIILGGEINEEVLTREFLDILVSDAMSYFYSDIKLTINVSYDV